MKSQGIINNSREKPVQDVTNHRASDTVQANHLCQGWGAKVMGTHETVLIDLREDGYYRGQRVVIDTKYGVDLAILTGLYTELEQLPYDHATFVRNATEEDYQKALRLQEKSVEAEQVFRQKINQHHLEMKPVGAHYVLDEDKLLFFFTSESRVDFRELVRDLVGCFHTRIELRQIGVRDESRMVGGRGVCGRCLCCHAVTDNLQPVSIKMAKVQNLSLNSLKISGPCGRLLCCLAFGHEAYREELQNLPREGDSLSIKNEVFRIIEVNPISRVVVITNRDGIRRTLRGCQLRYDQEKRRWSYDESAAGQARCMKNDLETLSTQERN